MPAQRPLTAFSLSRTYKLAPNPVHGEIPNGAVLELAWDGHRVMACRANKDTRIFSLDWREWTATFGLITTALKRIEAKDFVLDGFVCALGESGRPSFDALREHVASKKSRAKIVFVVWDAMRIDGEDLRKLPLRERRERLAQLLRGAPESIVLSEAMEHSVDRVRSSVKEMKVRGIVGRDPDAAYGTTWIASSELPWDRSLSPPPVVTNADKILFPRDNITKREMVAYYADIAGAILPYMRDRAIVCQRWPDGIDDFTWYQHRVPPRAPDYLKAVWVEGNRRIVIENPEALLWMANQAALTFHGFASRLSTLTEPDWVVLDLDPGENTTWEITIKIALALRKMLELLEVESVVKTSGQKGLHVMIPIAPGHTPQLAHEVGKRAAIVIARLFPNEVALEPTTETRKGRLYLDHLQSYLGKTLVLPYSLRAADGAPISTPIEWSEVTTKLVPRDFNLKTMRKRLDAKGDLAAPLLMGKTDLRALLQKMV